MSVKAVLPFLFSALVVNSAVYAEVGGGDHERTVTLEINEYIDLSLEANLQWLQSKQQERTAASQLSVIEKQFYPTLVVSNSMMQESNDTYDTDSLINTADLNELAMEMNWLSPSAAQVKLKHAHTYGRREGLSSLSIDGGFTHLSTSQLLVKQPVIGGLYDNRSRLPVKAAQFALQIQQINLRINHLQALFDAIERVVELQYQQDLLALLKQILSYVNYRVELVQELVNTGQLSQDEILLVSQDKAIALLDVSEAESTLSVLMASLGGQLNTSIVPQLKLLASMGELSRCLNAETTVPPEAIHPRLQLALAELEQARIAHVQKRYSTWPKVDLFYQVDRQRDRDSSHSYTRSWGVQMSHSLYDPQLPVAKANARSDWVNASYSKDMVANQLLAEQQQSKKQLETLTSQLRQIDQAIDNARLLYNHELEKLQLGMTSVAQVYATHHRMVELQKRYLELERNQLLQRLSLALLVNQSISWETCAYGI